MNEYAVVACRIAQINGKFHLVATITEQWYHSMTTTVEGITNIPLTAEDIKAVYPLGLLPD